MRQALILLATTALLFLASACSSSSDRGGRLRVVAVTTQIGDMARNVGGDRISLSVLMKPNQDAHDFEPQPSQARSMAKAAIVFRNGLGLDDFVQKAVQGSNAKVVVVSDAVKPRTLGSEPDPHVWFSVANAKLMVASIRDALAAADSSNAQTYRDNAERYLSQLDQLNDEIMSGVASIPANCRKLVTNHDVLGYYSEAYGLQLVGSVIPNTTSEAKASAADVADIVRKVRAEQVPAIFAEASINPALIRQVGREANVKVVDDLYGDSLGPKSSDGGTYIGMMRADTTKIVNALKDCPR